MTEMQARRVRSWVAVAVMTMGVLEPERHAAAAPQRPAAPAQPQGRGAMMGDRQAMMAAMQAQEKKLDALVAAMNGPGGTDKVDRVAAVVNELVAQHKAMHARMMTMMQGGMMGGRGAASTPAVPASPSEHDAHH